MSRLASLFFLLALLGLGLVGCRERPAPRAEKPASKSAAPPLATAAPTAVAAAGNAERGRALVQQFECQRCHEETGLDALPTARHCVRCHQDIEAGKVSAPAATLAKWKQGLRGVTHVPSLSGLARFKAEWLESYLTSPHDLRPALISTMPRLAITPEQARDIATYLRARSPSTAQVASSKDGDVARGRTTALARGCPTCHEFSGARDWPGARATGPAVELAPDLRFARQRLNRESMTAWLHDPQKLKPDALMPNLALSEAEIADLTAFVAGEALEVPSSVVPQRLPVLDRPVSYAEVDQKVFSVTCRHCHSNSEIAFGDGGPGFDGGFGFAPRRVDLSSHRGVSAGMLASDGQRHSLFERLADGTPRLLAVLAARQAEEAGSVSPALRGMPLGLPALSAEQIQLVESWIAQGHPL